MQVEDTMDEDLEVFPPLVLAKPTQVDSETEDDSELVKVITVQANLQACNRAEWFVAKEGPKKDRSSSLLPTVSNSEEEEEVPEPEVQVELYHKEEEEEDLAPEPYITKKEG